MRRRSGASPKWNEKNSGGAIQAGDYSGFETAASMYGGGAALGYIVIGLLAFLLGVCVTVLCFRLRQMNREDDQNKEREGIHGAD